MKKVAFIISNIEEYGKLISFCIRNDICVFRTYWDEREKGKRCYSIDWKEKRCLYSSQFYFEDNDYEIVSPIFQLDNYGNYGWCNNCIK
jgi:hypothetical protein